MNKAKSDQDLETMAKQELLREAKRGAERSSTMGTQGWLKPKLPTTNKRFLYRTLQSASVDICRTKLRSRNRYQNRSATESPEGESEQRSPSRQNREKAEEESCSSKDGSNGKRIATMSTKMPDVEVKKRKR